MGVGLGRGGRGDRTERVAGMGRGDSGEDGKGVSKKLRLEGGKIGTEGWKIGRGREGWKREVERCLEIS